MSDVQALVEERASLDLSEHGGPAGYVVHGTKDAIEWLRQQIRTLPEPKQQRGWGGQG